ncbi:MAG: hypothetical protein EVJ47_07415 [Candidatus Acidulodesulfobacterium ferriphilum]|uniref:Spore protein YkvP/CgeB glycosyl transferase-like domain-containing protein n=1 Tax=Candidatus Acidulodesulfobacterium ferriphilum TaxID=2597223 RepID=A0A519B9V1_9DELT|nr:MAG: hypothetical protein EVJ47_07415 [Candidatus Acidulodesulfobacterium ferriphilum]
MHYFEKNLKIIKESNEELFNIIIKNKDINSKINISIIDTKQPNLKSIKINNITIHSVYDPAGEAKKLINSFFETLSFNAERYLIFGIGCGYHIKEIINRSESDKINKKISAIEPSLDSLLEILENCDLSDILKYIDLFVFNQNINGDNLDETLNLSSLNLAFFSLAGYQKSFPEIYDIFYKNFNIKQLFNNSNFKVTVVQPLYGGSSTIGNYVYKAFLNLGYKANIIDFSKFFESYVDFSNFTANNEHLKFIRDNFINVLGEAIIAKLQDDKPDLVFFMAQSPVNSSVLQRIREMGIKTAFWFVEDFRVLTYWKEIAPYVDYFFTIQKDDFFEELKLIADNNYYYIPLACLPDFHKKFDISEINEKDKEYYGSDVSFAGAGYYNRRNAFLKLADYNFKLWGRDWDMQSPMALFIQNNNKGFTEEEVVKIYNYSKININLHSSTYHWDINPDGDFLNPRVYEILGCGGFQLVDNRKYMDNEFEKGKDFVVFDSISDLRQKINYYLKNEDERLEIAEHGYNTVRKYHTYEKRIEKMMNIILIDSYDFYISKFGNRKESLAKLLNSVKENQELYSIISEMINNGAVSKNEISIDDIVDFIRQGRGRLSKTEALILMLQQIKLKSIT